MHKKAAYRMIVCGLILFAAATVTHAADTLKASETFLLWPGTPPGARDGDDAKAAATAKAIKDGSYKIPGGNRGGIRVPACDVYLPPKAKRTGTAMVIYCGGGYGAVCIGSEGIPMAKWLNANGIAVFMVSYRCRPYQHPVPHWDVQRAIRLVRSRAKEFDVKPDKIGIMGFSAGGHVASTLSVHYAESFGRKPIDDIDKISARPSFSCLIYPVISMRKELTHGGSRRNLLGANPSEELVVKLSNDEQIDKNTPPAFLVHGKTDRVVKYQNSQRYHEACKKNGVPTKYILMSVGNHGPGMKDGKPSISRASEGYAEAMVKWIEEVTSESESAGKSVVAPGAKAVKVSGEYKFTEGPAVDAKGNVFFTDIPKNLIYKWSIDGKLSVWRKDSGAANGLFFDVKGNLLACEGGRGRVTSITPKGEVTVLASKYDGKQFNKPNDLWIDPAGGIYFSDPVYGRFKVIQDGQHVYYLSPDGKKITRVIDDMKKPNGIVGTPDGKILYVADHGGGKVYRYDIGKSGALSGKKQFALVACDGMTVDNEGNVYLTEKTVLVYNAKGKQIEQIDVPMRPTNACFGGADMKTLFVTGSRAACTVKMRVKGVRAKLP
ncbi:MAG: alpha/beta hydrolase fold domain-containing protein [Phycisphaerales bacterium]|jgi:gluconolactonase|nr:alpha/beta hydrolase fold domain-containing protein [Phycisphaerales bacterium]